jgi:phosphotriesterase-related protein|tara:strand:+ start:1027 stop:2025 length:999 start_codon:yes stop_codon:yes gene_type:complete
MAVESVSGAIDAESLGFVLVHEHIVCASAGIVRSWPSLYGGRERLINYATEVLNEAKAAGVDTIVDATPFDLGRDMSILKEVSQRSGVNIVAATGHWLMPSPSMLARTVEQLAEFFIGELTNGADGTEARAGIIKVASEDAIHAFDARVIEAAARANAATDAPILTHAGALHRIGEQQADLLEHHGVDPSRVVIGHCDDSSDIRYLSGLARRGYYIGMDRIPCGALDEYGVQAIEDRLVMLARLVDDGYADNLVVAHDDPIWAGLLSEVDQERHVISNPDRLAYISRVAVPRLVELGVTEEAVRRITVVNPAAWLAGGTISASSAKEPQGGA